MSPTTDDEEEYSEGICWINDDERVKHNSFVAHTLEFLQQENFVYNSVTMMDVLVHLTAKHTCNCTVVLLNNGYVGTGEVLQPDIQWQN